MRLKRFENINSDDELLLIKDVFQDLIDEWDLEILDNDIYIDRDGNYIRIKDKDHCILVNIFRRKNGEVSMVSDSPEFKQDVGDHIERLGKIGYSVRNADWDYGYFSFNLYKENI